MKKNRVNIKHQLWDKLRVLDKEATKRFPADFDRGFGSLGLILHDPPDRSEYWCDPLNGLTFASTGGNGVHFSFIAQEGKVTENSPIVVTIPAAGQPNYIAGESLFDFLCLGYHRGYFALETVGTKEFFDAYASGAWQPKEDRDFAVGYGVNEHQRKLLDFLIAELGLSPWNDLKRKFKRLQKLYFPLLEVPDDLG